MVLSRLGILLFSFIFFSGCLEPEKRNASQNLLNQFSSGCSSYGFFSKKSNEHTDSLITVMNSLIQNDNCKGLSGILPKIQEKVVQIKLLQKNSTVQERYASKERIRWLASALSKAQTDLDTQAMDFFSTELLTEKLRNIETESAYRSYRRYSDNENDVVGLTAVSEYLEVLFATETELANCIQDNPYLYIQLATSALAISGSFFNPALGPAIVMAGQAFTGLIGFLREEGFYGAIYDAKEGQMTTALLCAFESMSQTYCEAKDLHTLLKLHLQSENTDKTHPYWQAVQLYSDKLPFLTHWLRKVSNGVSPPTEYIAEGAADAITDYYTLRVIEKRAEGVILQTEALLVSSAPELHESIIRVALNKLTDILYVGKSGPSTAPDISPIGEVLGYNAILYAIAQNQLPPVIQTEIQPPATVKLLPEGVSFTTLANRVRSLLIENGKRVSQQLSNFTVIDPPLLLAEAKQKQVAGGWSPIEVLRDTREYIQQAISFLKTIPNQPELATIANDFQSTHNLLTKLLNILSAWDPGKYPDIATRDLEAKKQIEVLFNDLVLMFGETYLEQRIISHIRTDITNRLEHTKKRNLQASKTPKTPNELDELKKESEKILVASERDLISSFIREVRQQGKSPYSLINDLDTAMRTSIGNINLMMSPDFFGVALENSLEYLKSLKNSSANQELARLCIFILSTANEWPEDIDVKVCKNTVYNSLFPSKQRPLAFNASYNKLRKTPVENKICTLRDYIRQGEIFYRNTNSN